MTPVDQFLRSTARPGFQHLRLAFTGLPDAERDRLAAAVVRHQRNPSPEGAGPAR